jgi:hypothetical protein
MYQNTWGKTPATVWPLHVTLVLQNEHGVAIDLPDDLRTEMMGIAAEAPAVGDDVTIRVGDDFQDWRVVSRQWWQVFPVDGQLTPCSTVAVNLQRPAATRSVRATAREVDLVFAISKAILELTQIGDETDVGQYPTSTVARVREALAELRRVMGGSGQ